MAANPEQSEAIEDLREELAELEKLLDDLRVIDQN